MVEHHQVTSSSQMQNAWNRSPQNEQWFRAAIESSFDAVYLLRAVRNESGAIVDFQFIDLNERGAQLISRCREEVLHQYLCELLPVNRELGYFDKYKAVVETGIPLEEEFPADGMPGVVAQWLHHQVVPIADGTEDGIAITSRDITERKQVEIAIAAREKLYRTLTENLPDIIARVDRNLRHVYVNPAVTKATGLRPEAFIGRTNAEMGMPAEITQFWESKLNQVFATGQPDSYEFQFPAPDGTRYYLARVIPEFATDGSVETILGITSDITDLKSAELAVRQSEARFRRVVESNMIGLGFWNLEGDILSANDALLTMLGYQQAEFQNQRLNWRDITPLEYEPLDQKATQEIAEQGFCAPFEKELICKDGSRVPILCGGATFETSHDSGVFFVVDLTERKKIEAECERLLKLERVAREQAEVANRVKDEFLAVVSHELRTPLNPILGWIHLLKSQKIEADKRERALSIVESNARLQAQLVEDLLDVSQILQGKLRLSYCPVNVVEPVEAAIATVRLSAVAKAIQLHASLDHTIGRVLGNPSRIQQIVWNLLSNAVKFTPVGGQVEITLEPAGAFAQIRVSDTGQGIAPAFLPYVFDYFRQSDSSTTRSFGGLGLGLAIARHLVELHGGTIEAASRGVDQGSVFTVRLPLLQNDPKQLQEDNDSETETAPHIVQRCLDETLNGIRILVVDDHEESLEFITLALKQAGAAVTAATSIKEALQALIEIQPDVLISDITLPDQDGYSLMQQIRLLQPDLWNEISTIALTASVDETAEDQTLAAGYQCQISRPVDPVELISIVAALPPAQSVPHHNRPVGQ